MINNNDKSLRYRTQHKKRLNYMPWLFYRLKSKNRSWADEWQKEIQTELANVETVILGQNCFIAENSAIFAEPGRTITIGANSHIGADTFLHGPITIGAEVGINHNTSIDGGSIGVTIGNRTRIAHHCSFYAFNHGMKITRDIKDQPVSSRGITIGEDVWIGAHCIITDGVTIGDHAVIGANSTVTKDVPPATVVAGSPARFIRLRDEI